MPEGARARRRKVAPAPPTALPTFVASNWRLARSLDGQVEKPPFTRLERSRSRRVRLRPGTAAWVGPPHLRDRLTWCTQMTRNLTLVAIYVAGMALWLVPYLI